MTERRTVYFNDNGIRRTLITDDERPGLAVVRTEQVLDEILAGIARDRDLQKPVNDNRHLARIPVEIFERMILEGWGPDDEAKWLNSPEAAPFRIWKGKV